MGRRAAAGAAVAIALGMAGPAGADCSLSRVLQLPVTMDRHAPVVPATVDGHAAQFEVDSGAFYSTISPGSAAQFGLRLGMAPRGFVLTGIGGDSQTASVATVKDLGLADQHIRNLEFLVGGNEFGRAGLLGQNLLGMFDVEYDLAHGAVRLFRAQGCRKASLAYWADGKGYSVLAIKDVREAGFHTVGDVVLNDARLHATFDTGASTSLLNLSAAARAGLKPDSPGVEEAGTIWGLGRKRVRTWIGKFKSFKIGDNEEIRDIRVRFGDLGSDGPDMLVGADFFLAHRVFVDNSDRRLFLTYNGGPVFDLSIDPGDGSGNAPATVALAGPEPTTADAFSRRGAAYLSRRDVPRAIADLRQAVALDPEDVGYHRLLATALLRDDKKQEALGQLDRAIALKPDDLPSLLLRGDVRADDDPAGARRDADAFAAAAPRQANDRRELAALYERLHAPDQSIAAFTDWIDAHPGDIATAQALNGRCWVRALADRQLDQALDDCNRAVRLSSKDPGVIDSRALVYFRMGQWSKAVADYDAALAKDPTLAGSLYMRGLTESRAGSREKGQADVAAAEKIDPNRAAFFAGWGIEP